MTIHKAVMADRDAILAVAADTGMFLGQELDHFAATIDEQLSDTPSDHFLVSRNADDSIAAAAFWHPEDMTQGVANLLFSGTLATARRSGHGRALLAAYEVAAAPARLSIIETASDAMFAPAWELYRAKGYERVAVIPDYYDDGLDKLIFRKRLEGR